MSTSGYLATITGAGEQTLVELVANDAESPWIGAFDDADTTDAVFLWVTGEPWSYTNFAPGEPDDDAGIGGNGDCLALTSGLTGTWMDTHCNVVGFVIGRLCELPPSCIEP